MLKCQILLFDLYYALCLCTFVAGFFHVKVQERSKDLFNAILALYFSLIRRLILLDIQCRFILTIRDGTTSEFLYLFTFLVTNVSVLFLEGV